MPLENEIKFCMYVSATDVSDAYMLVLCHAQYSCCDLVPPLASNLHENSPFPRFYRVGHSASLCINDDSTPTSVNYSYQTVEYSPTETSQSDSTEGGDETHISPHVKRPKKLNKHPVNTIKVGIPTTIADIIDLNDIIASLNDSTMPISSKLGFIVAVLGGVPHISYPPTIEELQLYCHVITLLQRNGFSHRELIAILDVILKGLSGPVLGDYEPDVVSKTKLLDSMFECVWIDCGCNQELLDVLAPLLATTEDHARLLGRLGGLVALNPTAFVEFTHWKLYNVHKSLKELRFGNNADMDYFVGSLQDPPSRDRINAGFTLEDKISDIWKNNELVCDSQRFKISDSFSSVPSPIPASLVCFLSSIADVSTKQRHLVHVDLIRSRWPYFDRLLNSGLSESQTRLVELPLSDDTIRVVLGMFYGFEALQITLASSIFREILEHGSEFGFFSSLQVVNNSSNSATIIAKFDTPTFASLVNRALKETFPTQLSTPEAVVEQLNFAYQLGAIDWCSDIISKNRGHLLSANDGLAPELVTFLQ